MKKTGDWMSDKESERNQKTILAIWNKEVAEAELRYPNACPGDAGRTILKSLNRRGPNAETTESKQKIKAALEFQGVREWAGEFGFERWFAGYFKWLSQNPEIANAMRHQDPWKSELSDEWSFLEVARKSGNTFALQFAAEGIGRIIAKQLYQNDFSMGDFGEILSQLHDRQSKSHRSNKHTLVIMAFYTRIAEGRKAPSQSEVKSLLHECGHRISKEQISKIFDSHSLKRLTSDAREAMSAAGRRRRHKG